MQESQEISGLLRVIIHAMKLKNKKKVEIFLTEEWKQKVQDRAEKLGTTMAGVIKRALEEYLNE